MCPFGIQLSRGFLPQDLEDEDIAVFEKLKKIGALEQDEKGLYRLKSIYRVGRVYIANDGKGYLESEDRDLRDLLIEPDKLNGANSGDEVVVKRIIARRGRASARVVEIIKRAFVTIIGYLSKDEEGNISVLDIRTAQDIPAKMPKMDLRAFKIGTVFLIDAITMEVKEIFGHLGDAKVDERISLALYEREDDKFPPDCISQATNIPASVKANEIEGRVDLRDLPFCTIDPVSAKDFDDAIYFDTKSYTLYVAIADVSYYVDFFSPIDIEAKKRGFTTYFPHKAFPMLPRELSENICSLKPKVDRLAFVSKIKLEPNSLKPLREEFFKAVIHSHRRFNYDEVDKILAGDRSSVKESEEKILDWLLPLYDVTKRLKKQRMKRGFDFRTDEVRLLIDAEHKLKETTVETGTPSHSLIEECMLLANKAAANRFEGDGDSIFRIHEPPQAEKLQILIEELASVGIFIEIDEDKEVEELIRDIQKFAKEKGLEAEIDTLIIKSLKRASYSPFNRGHFGLGFEKYSHFTSPIRRYSDLILHRLIEADLTNDETKKDYLLRNIEPLCVRVSDLERKSANAEWDFMERKFARWALDRIGEEFEAQIVEIDMDNPDRGAKAEILSADIDGVIVNLKAYNAMLFDRVKIKITESNIAQAVIMGEQIQP